MRQVEKLHETSFFINFLNKPTISYVITNLVCCFIQRSSGQIPEQSSTTSLSKNYSVVASVTERAQMDSDPLHFS